MFQASFEAFTYETWSTLIDMDDERMQRKEIRWGTKQRWMKQYAISSSYIGEAREYLQFEFRIRVVIYNFDANHLKIGFIQDSGDLGLRWNSEGYRQSVEND